MLVPVTDEGFIVSHKYRRVIFDELAAGENNIHRIAKKHHIISSVARRILKDFQEHELIAITEQGIQLTDKGEKLIQTIGK